MRMKVDNSVKKVKNTLLLTSILSNNSKAIADCNYIIIELGQINNLMLGEIDIQDLFR